MANQIYIFWSERLGSSNFGWLIEPFLFDKKEYKQNLSIQISRAIRFVEMCCIQDYRNVGSIFVNQVDDDIKKYNMEDFRKGKRVLIGGIGKDFPSRKWKDYYEDKDFYYNNPRIRQEQGVWKEYEFEDLEDYDDVKDCFDYNYIKRFHKLCFGRLSLEVVKLEHHYYSHHDYYENDWEELNTCNFPIPFKMKPRAKIRFEQSHLYIHNQEKEYQIRCPCGAYISNYGSKPEKHWNGKTKKHLMWKHEKGYKKMLEKAKREKWENTPTIQQYDKGMRTDFIVLEF